MKNRFFKIISIALTLATPLSAFAAYTGPSAAPTSGNTPGPVWLSPSTQQTGAINVSSNVSIGGDINMSNAKAIRVDLASGSSGLNISNYGTSATGFTANIVGDLTISGGAFPVGSTTGTLRVPTICLNGTCRNSWPSGGSGTIGGSGTSGYIPLFSAASTLGNSIATQSGNNVKITSTDNSTTAYFTVLPQNLSQSVNIGYNHIWEAGSNGNNSLYIDSQTTGNLLLQANGGTGNVGIGTASPSFKLDVSGSGRFVRDTTINDEVGNLRLAAASDPNRALLMGYSYTGDYAYIAPIQSGTTWNKNLIISNYGGNVGMGTTAPAYKLDVNGDIIGNWHRSRGATGWYNETYAGGFYMSDASWIRSYNAKNLWMSTGLLGGDGGLTVGYGGASPLSGGAIVAGIVGIGTSSPAGNRQLNVYTPSGPGMTAIYANGSSMGGDFVGSNVGISASGQSTGVTGTGGSSSGGGTGINGSGGYAGGNFGNLAVPGNSAMLATQSYGVIGYSTVYTGAGVRGENTSSGAGVYGYSSSGGGTGVYGNGGMYGVQGESAGYGVYGYSAGGRGVFGSGGTYGVQASSNYAGMYSYGNSYSFYGGGGELYNAGLIRAAPNGAPYFCGGDDACLWDVNEANTVGIRGAQDANAAAIRMGASGGLLYGNTGYIGVIGTFYAGQNTNGTAVVDAYGGNAYFTRDGAGIRIDGAGNAFANYWGTPSDGRLKDVNGEFKKGLSELMKIDPIIFHYKKDNAQKIPSEQEHIGVIAQDLKEVVPEAVKQGDDGYYSVNPDTITWLEINAIKELKAENDALKKQNEDLLKRIEAIEAKLK